MPQAERSLFALRSPPAKISAPNGEKIFLFSRSVGFGGAGGRKARRKEETAPLRNKCIKHYLIGGNSMQKPQFHSLPPYCNTGVENTSGFGLNACIDWLQVTFKNEILLTKILDLIGMQRKDFFQSSGMYGYSKGLYHEGITILYRAHSNEMGIHLQISGTGCRILEQREGFNWVDFLKRINEYSENEGIEINISRLDIALDDRQGIFSIQEVIRKVKRGELTSRFKKAIRIETIDIETGASEGNTIYFGRATSDIRIRMYEKNYEIKYKYKDANIDENEVWNRVELQLRNDRATNMFKILVHKQDHDFAKEVKGVLMTYLQFRTRSKDSNKARWPIWRKWERFIGEVEKIKLTSSEPEKNLISSYLHVEKQYSALLAAFERAGLSVDLLLQAGEEKLSEKHLMKIEAYKKMMEEIKNNKTLKAP